MDLEKQNEHHSILKTINDFDCFLNEEKGSLLRFDFPDGMTIIPGINCFRRRLLK
jgi:hypothetical protein